MRKESALVVGEVRRFWFVSKYADESIGVVTQGPRVRWDGQHWCNADYPPHDPFPSRGIDDPEGYLFTSEAVARERALAELREEVASLQERIAEHESRLALLRREGDKDE